MSQLVCENLCLGYDGKQIVSNLSFTLNAGDYLCIVGENGSGKSTLMKTLLGLQMPMSGTITFGEDIKKNTIGYLPQQSLIQKDFPATVNEIVLSGCLSSMGKFPFYRTREKNTARQAMERMGILHLRNESYQNLSGGQQQRVLLARALCATRQMLLLDEPVSGLDPVVSKELYSLIQDLNKNDHITIIMVSHDKEYALEDASHVLHIGSNIFFGKKEDYLQSEVGKYYMKAWGDGHE